MATSVPEGVRDTVVWPFGQSGSATLVRWADKRYVFGSRHQLDPGIDDISLSERLFVSSRRQTSVGLGIGMSGYIPFIKSHHQTEGSIEEYRDLFFLEVAEHYDGMERDLPDFIDLAEEVSGKVECSVAFGSMAARKSTGDLVNSRSFCMYCYEDPKFISPAQFVRQYTYIGPADLDGLGGGAVFSLRRGNGGLHAGFEGIVMRGGNSSFRIISADHLRSILSKVRQVGKAA